jgi:hypothetical protein
MICYNSHINYNSIIKKWLGFLPVPLLHPYRNYIACDSQDRGEMLSKLVIFNFRRRILRMESGLK